MKLSLRLMLGAWIGFISGVVILIASPSGGAEAHAPFVYSGSSIQSWGALGVYNNWAFGYTRGQSGAKTVAVTDNYGLGSCITGSTYYPPSSWNKSDNLRTWVTTSAPVQLGTAVYIYSHPGDQPSLTHIHLFGWNSQGQWVQDNDLLSIFAWVGDVHITQGTINSGCSSAATVISHEVGHALGLDDEGFSHDTIMQTPNPGIRQSSSSDRRTEDYCIPVTRTYPC